MKLQTQIPFEKQSKSPIDHTSNVLLLGSCFALNMADKLEYFKFQNTANPFGIIFNPVSIEKLIKRALNNSEFIESDVFFHNERWHCFEAHSALSASSSEVLIAILNTTLRSFKNQIHQATHLILTYGTAWVYRNKISNEIVANCHKVSQNQFDKEILSIEMIEKSILDTIDLIRKVNPKSKIIFTVSPVRHIKDGFIENTLSKAHLISSIHQFINQQSLINNQQSFYFPSYEIMLDELRDYRFYAEDMLHPNAIAINYIWEKFKNVWLASTTEKTMNDVELIQKGIKHRAFNPDSVGHQQFLQQLEIKKQQLQSEFPHIQF